MVNNPAMDLQKAESLWAHLHWLIVLGQQGSYTAAAARLGVSKAAMSQRIAELERAVGVTLVRRTTRSMRLTEAGQQLVDQTRDPFEQIAHSFLQAQDQAGEPRGLIRVTAPVALGRQQLLPRLADFLLAHPSIRVEMELSDRLKQQHAPAAVVLGARENGRVHLVERICRRAGLASCPHRRHGRKQ